MNNKFSNIFKKIFYKIVHLLAFNENTKYLGTNYGGWYLISKNLKDSIIISAGVGEDISFDIEFLNEFGGKIIFIDPTPRALEHLHKVLNSLGNKKISSYESNSGKQRIDSYDLSKLSKESFIIVDKALSNKNNKVVKFYSPPDPDHVSHSISNWQNNFKKNGKFINVETTTLKEILSKLGINKIDLIKLDIEGSENQVLPNMIRSKIFPDQILVEFDELHGNHFWSYLKATLIILRLFINGYKLIATDKYPDFLFVKKK